VWARMRRGRPLALGVLKRRTGWFGGLPCVVAAARWHGCVRPQAPDGLVCLARIRALRLKAFVLKRRTGWGCLARIRGLRLKPVVLKRRTG
jgi:hypothetical protein